MFGSFSFEDIGELFFNGRIKISLAIKFIVERVAPTIEEENIDKFKDECRKHFYEEIKRNSITLFSPETRLSVKLDSDESGIYHIVPTDWVEYYIKLSEFNFQVSKLDLKNIVPRLITLDEEKDFIRSDPYTWNKLHVTA